MFDTTRLKKKGLILSWPTALLKFRELIKFITSLILVLSIVGYFQSHLLFDFNISSFRREAQLQQQRRIQRTVQKRERMIEYFYQSKRRLTICYLKVKPKNQLGLT